jgi:membrane protein required for colicin V production
MQTLDWVVAGGLLLSVLLGAWRGLVFEVVSLLGWVAAFVAARLWGQAVGLHLPLSGASEGLRQVVGFVLVFVVGVLIGGLVAAGLKALLSKVGLRPADRALGALFGLLRGGLLLLLAVALAEMTPVAAQSFWKQSQSVQAAQSLLHTLKPWVAQDLMHF